MWVWGPGLSCVLGSWPHHKSRTNFSVSGLKQDIRAGSRCSAFSGHHYPEMMSLLDSCHPLLVDTVPLTSFCASWVDLCVSPGLLWCSALSHGPSEAIRKGQVPIPTDPWSLLWDHSQIWLVSQKSFNSPQYPCSGWLVPCLTPALYLERPQVAWRCLQVHVLNLFSTPLSTLVWASGTQSNSYINTCPWVSGAKHRAEGAHHCPVDFIIQASLRTFMALEGMNGTGGATLSLLWLGVLEPKFYTKGSHLRGWSQKVD